MQMLGLIAILVVAIAGAKGLKSRLLALLIIAACMIGGLGIGLLIGMHENAVAQRQTAMNLMFLCGVFSAIYRIYMNRVRGGKSWPATGR